MLCLFVVFLFSAKKNEVCSLSAYRMLCAGLLCSAEELGELGYK